MDLELEILLLKKEILELKYEKNSDKLSFRYNENHDPGNGQFTSGPGGGSGSAEAASGGSGSTEPASDSKGESGGSSGNTKPATDSKGESGSESAGGGKSEGDGAAISVSAEGANVSCKGFSSPERLTAHFEKHKQEFGFSSEEEYQTAADMFLQQPCNGDIIGYVTPKGKVVRFNTKTTEYATGFPGQNICTYMKAKCNKDGTINPERAMEYYIRHKQEGE